MRELPVIEDKRLLGALDYIDEKYIAEVTESYKVFEESDGKISVRKALKTSVKQIAILAACVMLLSLAIPIVSYIVPQMGEMLGGNAGNIGEPETLDMEGFADMSERDLIEHVGEVPREFKDIVEQNLFADIRVSGGKIIKEVEDPYGIEVYDYYGKFLHRIDIKVEKPEYGWWKDHKIHSLSDGTYLLFIPYHAYRGSEQAYKGIVTDARAVCFDEKGNILFNTKLDITDELCEFEFFYETDDAYLLIGGSYQKRNSYFIKLDKSGNILKSIEMGGNESDRLYWVYYTDNDKLMLYMREHTFSKNSFDIWEITMDENYNILDRTLSSYTYPDDALFPNFRQMATGSWNVRNFVLGYNPGHKDDPEMPMLGYVSSVIEYDDFVLIVSKRDTKWFEYVPMIYSTIPSYTETVYSAYTYDGELIWRSAVDSTDYERLAEVKKAYEEERERINKWRSETE